MLDEQMTEAEQRAAVVAEALTWLRTPYAGHGRVKGAGVDCANFPAATYEAVGVLPHLNPNYSEQWYLHHDSERYLTFVKPYAREITREQAQAGDFVIWKFGRTFSHGAIVLTPPQIIHATLAGGCVHLGDMDGDDDFGSRPRRFYTWWGV